MLDGSPLIKRLLLCLLASAGLHGGLVLVVWQEAPLRQVLLRDPLEVARVEVAASHQTVAVEAVPAPATDAMEKILLPPPRPVVTTALPRPLTRAKTAQVAQVARPAEPLRRMVEEPLAPQEQPLAELQAHLAAPAAQVVVPLPAAGSGSVEALLMGASGHTATARPSASVSELLVEATPAYRSNPRPEYPLLARQRRWQGVVWLRVDVTAAGNVNAVQIESSSGHAVLDRAAMRSVERWRFAPATRGGVPVDSRVRLPVHFVLKEG